MSALPSLLLAHVLRCISGVEPGPGPDELELRETEVRYVAAALPETSVRARPWVPNKRIATISDGTRLVVRGVVDSRDDEGCKGQPWYALWPFGFVCSRDVEPTTRPPAPGSALPLEPGRRVPHTYAYVKSDGIPLFAGYDAVDGGVPTRPLSDGMSLVVARELEYAGREWIQTGDGALVPKAGVRYGGQGSEWSGVELEGRHAGPSFAWTLVDKGTPVRRAPTADAESPMKLGLRTRVPLLERAEAPGGKAFWRVGEGLWIDGAHLAEVHLAGEPPRDVLDDWRRVNTGNDQWIDVDLGEQVLVAYRGDQAVFATLISSGRGHPTPRGNYPVWAKVASMTMANQAYEDEPYMVQGVPWVLLFQAHNALHGAYWHDRFGNRKSHGCVNLAPHDARYVFEWSGPMLPQGWTGYLPSDLRRSVVVHVHDSSRADDFTQDRPIGPPDREAEKAKAEQAEARRAEAAVERVPYYDPAFVPDAALPEPGDHPGDTPDPRSEARRIEPSATPSFRG